LEIAEVVPLGGDQVRPERTAVLDEHLVEGLLARGLREAQHLAPQRTRLFRIVPADNLREAVPVEIVYSETLLQLLAREALREVPTKAFLTVLAQAVVAIEVVGDEAIDAALHTGLDPRLEYRSPRGIIEATPVLLHAADAVGAVDDGAAVSVFLEQVARVGYGAFAEALLVPEVAVELEETGWSLWPVGVTDKELDVEVTDNLYLSLVEFPVEVGKPLAALVEALDGEMGRVALAEWRVGEAVEVSAVEADLHQLGLCVVDKRQVIRSGILVPVGDHAREEQPRFLGASRGAAAVENQDRNNEQRGTMESHESPRTSV